MHTDYVSESEIMSEAPLGLGRETTQSSCYLQDMGFENEHVVFHNVFNNSNPTYVSST